MVVLLYVPCKDDTEAEKIATALLSERLIVCANILPSKSLYPWEGKIARENESVLLAKTDKAHAEKAKTRITKLHSYTVPCILTLNADANKKYEQWVLKELGKK